MRDVLNRFFLLIKCLMASNEHILAQKYRNKVINRHIHYLPMKLIIGHSPHSAHLPPPTTQTPIRIFNVAHIAYNKYTE